MEVKALKLTKPIMVDGKEVKELPYDLENLTARDKLNASKYMRADGIAPTVEELDSIYHLYIFAEAVKKVDSKIDTADVLRMSAKDSSKAAALVRNFFYLDSEV